jgi:hypothetical protein
VDVINYEGFLEKLSETNYILRALVNGKSKTFCYSYHVDAFTSTKSTHWQSSNELPTRPKVHISSLKVNDVGKAVYLLCGNKQT